MSTAVVPARTGQGCESLEQLRHAFDQAFASAPSVSTELLERMLAVRVAGQPFAMRVDDITGLAKVKRITSLPSRHPELLGIAGIRGVLVPVFDLAKLVGLETQGEEPRWLALATCEQPIGLAFDEFEGQVDAPSEAIYTGQDPAEPKRTRLLAQVGSSVRPVVDVPGILEAIRKSAGLVGPERNQL